MAGVRPEDRVIQVNDLCFGYASPKEIYSGFNWSVSGGESWAVLGPSGCGKTTLVYLLAGLRLPSGGRVLIDGTEVRGPRLSTGLILQDHGLLPWAKARDNVALGLRIRQVAAADRDATVRYWLERLGIDGVAEKYPGQISGGQRQRVAIARTLALKPSLLLMDEPFSSLDSSTREDLQELVVGLSEGSGMTTVLVTHDLQEAVFLGKKILIAGHPPIAECVVVDNQEARRPGYRQSPAFFEMCARVRAIIGELMNRGDSLPPSIPGKGHGHAGGVEMPASTSTVRGG